MTTVRSLRRLFQGSGRLLALSVCASAIQSALLVPVALAVRYAFNTLIPHDHIGRLALVTAGAFSLYVVSAAIGLGSRYVVLGVTKRSMTRVRAAMLETLHRLPKSWFDSRDLATVHSTVVQDGERLEVMITLLLAQLVPATIISLALCVMLIALVPLLFLVLVPVALLLLAVNTWLGRTLRRRARVWQKAVDSVNRATLLGLRSMTLSRAHAVEEAVLAQSRRDIEVLADAGREVGVRSSTYTTLQGALAAMGGAALLVVGGAAVASHDLRLGDLASFFAVAVLLRGQLQTIALSVPQVISGSQSLARIVELLDQRDPEPYSGSHAIDFSGAIALDDVDFGYDRTPVLRGASMSVNPGEWVALVGPNGAGKSTILKLVLGLYRPASGRVRADGMPLDDLDLRAVRRRIGALLEEPVIFPGSIADNIDYGWPGADRDRIESAAELAVVTEFAARLPHGLDTTVGDDGVRLSAGQRQRIAIARALVREPALLLLDEPTDHLDEASAHALLANLRSLPTAPAVLLVTHDRDVAAQADRVYRLAGGHALPAGELASSTA